MSERQLADQLSPTIISGAGFGFIPNEIKAAFGKPRLDFKKRYPNVPADLFLKPLPKGEHPDTAWRRGLRHSKKMKSSRAVGLTEWDAGLPTFPSSAAMRRDIF
jgi:hypothetical protein